MPVRWVLFDLNGTLVDPAVLAQPLGDTPAAEELVQRALDAAIAQAMVTTLTGRHAEFATLIDAALWRELTLARLDPALTAPAMALLGSMPAFLEAPGALERLRGEGMRLGVLTQSSTRAAEQVLRFAGLRDRLDLVLGADEVGAFKPDPRVYEAALARTGAAADETCLVAAHWWDVTGAARAGLRTGWVARRERVLLSTVPEPDVSGRDLAEVAEGIVALA
ncbi:MAG: 2-haloacid dehalogenase [Solirubrobacteraceae bacterium]|nr:2-haloacid dehalogenase [Solirubrobacteraceae bacterium]